MKQIKKVVVYYDDGTYVELANNPWNTAMARPIEHIHTPHPRCTCILCGGSDHAVTCKHTSHYQTTKTTGAAS